MDADRLLTRSYSEKSGKGCRNPKELDGDRARSWSEGIASQPFFPGEPGVSTPASRERGRVRCWLNLEGLFQMYINPLIAHKLHACPSMLPSTPVTPEERPIPDDEWMQENTHLARLRGFAAIPLTLLAQQAGAAAAETGCVHDAQAAIGFSTPFMGKKRLPCWTPERPIGLERKVGSGETTRFEGSGGGRWTVSRGRSG